MGNLGGCLAFLLFVFLYTRRARASGDYKDLRWEEANQHERYLHLENVSNDLTKATICFVGAVWCFVNVLKELL